MRTGDFPGYSHDVVDIGLPAYAWTEIGAELSEAA
jgi:hypothetical protein